MGQAGSRRLLERHRLIDDTHHVAFLHDEQVLAAELYLGAGPFAEQDAVADLHVERNELASFVPGAGADGDDLALLRLFLGSVWDDDAAGGLFIGLDTADQDTVMQWTERHIVLLKDKQILRGPSAPIREDRRGARATLSASRAFRSGFADFRF